MSDIVAYDLWRLFKGPNFKTPRGIDRVDLAMANYLFADPDSRHLGILPTPMGTRAYPADIARQLLIHLQLLWGENSKAEDDNGLKSLIAEMQSHHSPAPHPRAPDPADLTRTERLKRTLGLLRHTGIRPGLAVANAVPPGAVYLNVGQLGLAMPASFSWLDNRPDVTCALMIHDTIPLDHPELVMPASVARHARMIGTAANHANCLIFSTKFASSAVNAVLERLRHDRIPSLVRPLPVPAAFVETRAGPPELAGKHYFVVVSTIEPRKNYTLLFRIWETMIAATGEQAPHLVIVGAPGMDAVRILAPLAGSQRLQERVHHIRGLSSPALARLVAGCAALLSPSYAEGFGLPLLEGIAMGVPTIASDIPSHREIAHSTTTLLGADDQLGWEHAIRAIPRATSNRCRRISVDMTEESYCADLISFIRSVPSKSEIARIGKSRKIHN